MWLENDKEIILILEYCEFDNFFYWLGVVYVFKGFLLVFGVFFVWEICVVIILVLNDLCYIG